MNTYGNLQNRRVSKRVRNTHRRNTHETHKHIKYKKLTPGTRKYSPLSIKVWLWGFGYTYETKKKIGGFVIAKNAGVPAIDVKSDAFRRKHPKA